MKKKKQPDLQDQQRKKQPLQQQRQQESAAVLIWIDVERMIVIVKMQEVLHADLERKNAAEKEFPSVVSMIVALLAYQDVNLIVMIVMVVRRIKQLVDLVRKNAVERVLNIVQVQQEKQQLLGPHLLTPLFLIHRHQKGIHSKSGLLRADINALFNIKSDC